MKSPSEKIYKSRPIYENAETIRAERILAHTISGRWNCTPEKLPRKYAVDYALLRHGKLVAWAEFKSRSFEQSTYGTYMISLMKLREGAALSRLTGKPFYLVVEWTDVVGWCQIPLTLENYFIGIGGRFDRNDPEDLEPVVHIPITDFAIMIGKDD